MKSFISKLFAFLCLLTGVSCTSKTASRMPIYVMPWYNSEGLVINVGKYSEALKQNTSAALLETARQMKEHLDQVPIEALYVLAVRLYDMDEKEESAYWFYVAQFRARVFNSMLAEVGGMGDKGFELQQAFASFNQLAGTYINGYIGGNVDEWVHVIERAGETCKNMGYVGVLYPDIKFRSAAEQSTTIARVYKGLMELKEKIFNEKEEIKRIRKKNGADEKY